MKTALFVLGLLGAAIAIVPSAQAQSNYPWCSHFSDGAGVNCGFSSYQQCMATAAGSGGTCQENDWYKGANTAAPAQRQARKRHSKNS